MRTLKCNKLVKLKNCEHLAQVHYSSTQSLYVLNLLTFMEHSYYGGFTQFIPS